MIEIAISLAVIGFALVAILGVLPLGMNVQKENREETIINQDASMLMNAIRNGARGMDDLTNYVMAITNYVTKYDRSMKPTALPPYWYTTNNSSISPQFALINGSRIIGLLSTPKFFLLGGYLYSNHVVAYVRSMSGPASEKFPQNSPAMQDLAFNYRVLPEVEEFGTSTLNGRWGNVMPSNLQSNLHEVRLNFRWPLAKGFNAPGRQVFRTLVGGQLTNDPPGQPFYFFQPQTYVKAP